MLWARLLDEVYVALDTKTRVERSEEEKRKQERRLSFGDDRDTRPDGAGSDHTKSANGSAGRPGQREEHLCKAASSPVGSYSPGGATTARKLARSRNTGSGHSA